jgi:quinohemoprotein ethanol dehydrogenase
MVSQAGAMMGNQMLSIAIGQQPEYAPPVISREEQTANTGLLAWDPVQRKAAWRNPEGSSGSGVLSTAGNLLFQGNGANLLAFRADTGEKVWSAAVAGTGGGIVGGPVSYALDGVQYVAGVGLNARGGTGRLVVFKLGGTAQLPAPPPAVQQVLNPPANFGDEAMLARGQEKYAQNCAICHENGRQMGGFPDLRYSAFLNSDAGFKAVVIDGALTEAGMLSFRQAMTEAEAEAVRAHLVSLANTLKSAPPRAGGGGRGGGPGGGAPGGGARAGGPGGAAPAVRPPQPGGGMGTLAAPGAAAGSTQQPGAAGELHQ